jgi:SpoVK/Ycf46/Vps4 family AAA+-type ATPase
MGLAASSTFIQTIPVRVAGMALGYCAYERFAQIVNAKSSIIPTNYLSYIGLIAGALVITQQAIVIYAVALLVLIPLQYVLTKEQLIAKIPSFLEDMHETVGLENHNYTSLPSADYQITVFINMKEKSNVMIIGPAGSGKTALIEGIIQRICASDSTLNESLRNKKFYRVDCLNLMSDTNYRGDLEKRIKNILEFAKSQKNSVIVFDEMHQLAMTNKGYEGGNNISILDLFKASLARGGISVIGMTTKKEFATYLENDEALTRRFNIVELEPPSHESSLEMLKERAKGLLKDQQNITIAEGAYEEVLTLAQKLAHQKKSSLIDRAYTLLQAVFTAISIDESRRGKSCCVDRKEIKNIHRKLFCPQFKYN